MLLIQYESRCIDDQFHFHNRPVSTFQSLTLWHSLSIARVMSITDSRSLLFLKVGVLPWLSMTRLSASIHSMNMLPLRFSLSLPQDGDFLLKSPPIYITLLVALLRVLISYSVVSRDSILLFPEYKLTRISVSVSF